MFTCMGLFSGLLDLLTNFIGLIKLVLILLSPLGRGFWSCETCGMYLTFSIFVRDQCRMMYHILL